jgi:hypothetical protein
MKVVTKNGESFIINETAIKTVACITCVKILSILDRGVYVKTNKKIYLPIKEIIMFNVV